MEIPATILLLTIHTFISSPKYPSVSPLLPLHNNVSLHIILILLPSLFLTNIQQFNECSTTLYICGQSITYIHFGETVVLLTVDSRDSNILAEKTTSLLSLIWVVGPQKPTGTKLWTDPRPGKLWEVPLILESCALYSR
ncbi:hypothetical protein Lser_V15G40826 [Lactuca serriola]